MLRMTKTFHVVVLFTAELTATDIYIILQLFRQIEELDELILRMRLCYSPI